MEAGVKISLYAATKNKKNMTLDEFSELFDVQYNNITSNQAPGLNEYEKSVFLTKAQDEIIKNYFTANSKGNNIQQGFDDSAKRQADFSVLMKTASATSASIAGDNDTITYSYEDGEDPETHEPIIKEVSFTISKLDNRSKVYSFPSDVFIIINESLTYTEGKKYFQVIPLRYDEYTRLMSKPFKRPLKHQAWRLINSGSISDNNYIKCVEVITTPEYDDKTLTYTLRYLRRPLPIIVGDIDGLKINGKTYDDVSSIGCELDPILHEDVLQRAVELAKIAWTSTGQDNAQMFVQAGDRSE